MNISPELLNLLKTTIGYGLFACFAAFLWTPLLTKFLYKYQLTRQAEYDATLSLEARKGKANVPIMGGLLVIITVAAITILFNWERKFTWVPIGVMLLAALLGGIDDVMNIYGHKRRSRKTDEIIVYFLFRDSTATPRKVAVALLLNK